MLLKQNCFVLSETEQLHLETDTYITPKLGFTGSSLQRKVKKIKELTLTTKNTEKNCTNEEIVKEHRQLWLNEIREKQYTEEVKKSRSVEKIEHSLSAKSKTKIRSKIIAWANTIPHKQNVKFTFLTLTLTSAQRGSDKDFTKMQNVLFTYLRKYYPNNFKRYLYVLERQTKTTGNIHSHIVVSAYLPIKAINRLWCKILSDHGYTYNQNGEILSPIDALKRACKAKGLSTPSPVDIRVIHDLKSVSSYITKYITKNVTSIETNIWNCSQWVSRLWTGAHICAKTHLLALKRFVVCEKKISLDNGSYLTVYLLNNYTGLQKSIFSQVNKFI